MIHRNVVTLVLVLVLVHREMEHTLAFGQTMSFVQTILLCVE